MYRMTCPECAVPMEVDEGQPGACPGCGWSEGRRSAPVEPGGGRLERPLPTRKRRRRTTQDRPEGRPSGIVGYAVGLGVLLVVWAALIGLAFATPTASLGLAALGVLTTLVGVGWVLTAARQKGIQYLSFTPIGPAAAVIAFVLAVLTVLIVMAMHLAADFRSAWRPALVLLVGLAMTASGVVLLMR